MKNTCLNFIEVLDQLLNFSIPPDNSRWQDSYVPTDRALE